MLGVIEVEGATARPADHALLQPLPAVPLPELGYENTGTTRRTRSYAARRAADVGADTPTATGAKIVDGKVYVNNGFWDTYRTTWPAYSLFTPRTAGEMVDGFVQQYKDGGWISRWSSPGYANLMTGTSSDVAFADAYLKGVAGIDVARRYDAALKNATVVPPTRTTERRPQGHRPSRPSSATRRHDGRGRLLVAGGLPQRLRHREHGEEAARRGEERRPARAGVRGRATSTS